MWKSKKHTPVPVVAIVESKSNGVKVDGHGQQNGYGHTNGFHDHEEGEGYFQDQDQPGGKSNGICTSSNGHVINHELNGSAAAAEHENEKDTMVPDDDDSPATTVQILDEATKPQSNGTTGTAMNNNNGISPSTLAHSLWSEIDRITLDQLHYAKLGVGEGGWSLFAKDGEMKMYKREEEVDGLIMDPLKAVHAVKGVTARELCHYFYSPEFRTEWETTLETMNILETVSADTAIFHQIHTRIWPATQRDALFWSHIRQVHDGSDGDDRTNTWIVCNHSTKHTGDPCELAGKKSKDKYIRILLTVSMVCQTAIDKSGDGQIKRDDLTCHINYCSVVNPGGWAPASGVRAVYKREYPRFLKKFTQYVIDKCKDKPIMF